MLAELSMHTPSGLIKHRESMYAKGTFPFLPELKFENAQRMIVFPGDKLHSVTHLPENILLMAKNGLTKGVHRVIIDSVGDGEFKVSSLVIEPLESHDHASKL